MTSSRSNMTDLAEYMFYHNSLDEFIWLIKLLYSPVDIIKKKKYRVSSLFQYYIEQEIVYITQKPINFRNSFASPKSGNQTRFEYYLKQGWYNELAASYPNNNLQDHIGTNISSDEKALWQTELFPSWVIVKTYYSIYAYYNALLFTNQENCDTYRHRNPTNHFNTALLSKFSKTILKYPFNIVVEDKEHSLGEFRLFQNRKEWKYKYASYPRELSYDGEDIDVNTLPPEEITRVLQIIKEKCNSKPYTFYDVEDQFYKNLDTARALLKCKAPVNIIDLMYLFRTWANYTGSDTYISLQKGGYLRFLQKNLYVLNYFIAGITEIVAIVFLGEKRFVEVFTEFYNSFIFTRYEFLSRWSFIPMINRIMIYKHMGLLSFKIEDALPMPKIEALVLVERT